MINILGIILAFPFVICGLVFSGAGVVCFFVAAKIRGLFL